MSNPKHYFFCGIGGSGMLPLAMILRAGGHAVSGSDRSRDQGRSGEKFAWLEAQGIALHPQDGSGLTRSDQILVASAAVEDSVPDVAAANRLGCIRLTRAQLLARLFNDAARPIGVAGTSGKSTTTAMIAWILHEAGRAPTVMNGAVMKNFVAPGTVFASALTQSGQPELFVSEVDESDGSIALYDPTIAVLNNVSLDHKSMDELRALFGDFIARADVAVLNFDDGETRALAPRATHAITYAIEASDARLKASEIEPAPTSIRFTLTDTQTGNQVRFALPVPGRHNVSNAMAAAAAAMACGVPLSRSGDSLSRFAGIKRRFEIVGEAAGIPVIDDFGHNPDKIAATLRTLHDFPGRLLVLFQPHGFGPLAKMRREFVETFSTHLAGEDRLYLPEPVYFGGTVSREVTSADLASDISAAGRLAHAFESRAQAGEALVAEARPGDRIIIMGARDDTLSDFAETVLTSVRERLE